MISIIVCGATTDDDKLAIGRNDNLLFKLKYDMIFFKNITTYSLLEKSHLNRNIVIMGRKTYFSIPENYRPLINRINLVFTNNTDLITELDENLTGNVYFINMDMFDKIYEKYNPNVFVIGGSEIYNLFKDRTNSFYVTYVKDLQGNNIIFSEEDKPDTFINKTNFIPENFDIYDFYGEYFTEKLSYRMLCYKK